MAMIEWVDRRLHNWAMWVERGGSLGLGYARLNLMAAPSDGAPAEAVIPCDAIEASETHDQVMRLPSELRRVVELYYTVTTSRAQLAVQMHCAVATVDARLGRAHRTLGDAFNDLEEQRRAKREQMLGEIRRRGV